MENEYKAIITVLLAGAALIHLLVKSKTGWIVLLVLGVPIAGMGLASASGNETLVWVFGLVLMLAVPLWLAATILLSAASFFQRGGKKKR